ncbi:hypothetical protein DY000_02060205 [Brassica cretica]|uniref:Uncharacterized protein n=1 Tax=Brassica cretica TaxID=69181 RepID=A0ABQ7ASN4_BRACR|nr:hypothetical protein DY000_02060205 [Brassica cretica]
MRNAGGQRLNDQGTVSPDLEAVALEVANDEDAAVNSQAVADENVQAARLKTFDDYNRLDQYFSHKSAIRSPAFKRNNFKLKPSYFSLVGQTPYHGHTHEHPMDHLERFEPVVSAIKDNRAPEDYLLYKLDIPWILPTFSYGILVF